MRGSSWHKWNFHVHTKGTNKNDQFVSAEMNTFFEVFFKKALKEKINAIAITDYFSIDNYLKAIEYVNQIEQYQDANRQSLFSPEQALAVKKMLILPNVELRMLPSTQAGKLINIHCIFNPEYVPRLANDFFNTLENQERYKMNREGFIQYGRTLKSSLDDTAAYKMGVNNFVIGPGSLKDLLDENVDFRNNTIVVVSNSNKDGNSGLQEHYSMFENEPGSLDGVRRTIYSIADAVFSTSKRDITYFLGKRRDNEPGVTEEQKHLERQLVLTERGAFKACLVGCDAHTEADLFKRFTWVKGLLNFQGLRQIMYEPDQRVKIQDDEPDLKDAKLIIDQVSFKTGNETFTATPIRFNKNLNVIIGGKSSGKSILLYCIAKTLLPDRSILKNEHEPFGYKYEFEAGFDFEVTIAEGHTQSINRSNDTPSILPEIKYIPQNHLSRLAESDNKKGNELVKLIRTLLLEEENYKVKYKEFIDRVKSNDSNTELIINSYFELKSKIADQKRELIQQGDRAVLVASIVANEQKIQKLKEGAGLTDEQIGQYNKLNKELTGAEVELSKLRTDHSKLTTFHTDSGNILTELVQRKDLLLQSLENERVRLYFEEQYNVLQESLTKIKAMSTLIILDEHRNFVNDNIFKTIFEENNETKRALTAELDPFLKDLANKKQIEDTEKLVADDQHKLAVIEQMRSEISNNELALSVEKDKLFSTYIENFEEYKDLVVAFRGRTESLANDRLTIIGKPRFNFPKFRTTIVNKMDGRKAYFDAYPLLSQGKTGTSDFEISELVECLKTMFEQMTEVGSFPFTSKADVKASVKELFADYFFDYWNVVYDNDELTKMSSGKASFVILMLIVGLSKSKAPILIDQPEDNLDNRSITKDLVEYLRNKKLERQIILVTHNANVVVNADAENIIVANQKGQNDNETSSPFRFDYINGALEMSTQQDKTQNDLLKSMGIREHVTEIVEGGEEAFRKRERKYGFAKR